MENTEQNQSTCNFSIGMEVIRTKGDYVRGRTGQIVAIDHDKQRVQVAWKGSPKTWVKFDVIERI